MTVKNLKIQLKQSNIDGLKLYVCGYKIGENRGSQ